MLRLLQSVDRLADWIAFVVFEDHHVGSRYHDAQPPSAAVRIATALGLAAGIALMTVLLALTLDTVLDLTSLPMPGL